MRLICTIVLLFIVLDVVAGFIAAAKNHELNSTIMRDGMYNKLAEIMLLGVAVLCDFILSIEPFSLMGIPEGIMFAVVVYLVAMELLSILENICRINPELPISKILLIFNIDVDTDDGNDVESKSALGE